MRTLKFHFITFLAFSREASGKMEWLRGLIFISCALCAFGLNSPRPPSSPSSVEEVAASRSSFPMPGDIVEGDIVLDDNTAALLRGGARNAMANVNKWPNGVVPYILDSSVDDYLRQQIDIGIAEYHKYTCLRFVKRTVEKNYIRIVKPASGCNSMVGVVGNGEQILNMGPGCEYVGLVLHEFGHAIGYFHEHNRPDRDNVIEVLWDNVQPAFKSAFKKYTFQEADTQGYSYDLTSIMHYENSAFGKAGFCKTTIIVRNNPSYEVRPVYERGVFSPQDIKKINKLYGCPMKGLPDVVKPGTNNPDPNACVCEDKHAECQSWKDRGECGNNNAWMSSNCPKSCRVCGEPDSDCKDEYPQACSDWSSQGECQANPTWMGNNCKKSCNKCSTTVTNPPSTQSPPTGDCKDVYPTECPNYKSWGWCTQQDRVDYMKQVCSKTCNFCGGSTGGGGGNGDCKDVYPQYCPDYKSRGMCTDPNYVDYCKEVCKSTCGYC
ncbi:zinc metalloproteinase nas-6-like isoform X2 [Actinia tenebrosa]|uniref:Metalloendopeptidase n=1 Tax=Actinia tenebrosa TaxID=6105 RepID=A0A6P8H9B4_ACTTE|nr:zinc metalloproteinase nas-6-like isoform X2 [Actinia tenebrosa]